jgi:hypothetical protein
VVAGSEEVEEELPFFLWCFLWCLVDLLELVLEVLSAQTMLDAETVKSRAKAITNAFFILTSFE